MYYNCNMKEEDYFKSKEFKESIRKKINEDTWDKDLPKIYMDENKNIIKHYKDGRKEIIKYGR